MRINHFHGASLNNQSHSAKARESCIYLSMLIVRIKKQKNYLLFQERGKKLRVLKVLVMILPATFRHMNPSLWLLPSRSDQVHDLSLRKDQQEHHRVACKPCLKGVSLRQARSIPVKKEDANALFLSS